MYFIALFKEKKLVKRFLSNNLKMAYQNGVLEMRENDCDTLFVFQKINGEWFVMPKFCVTPWLRLVKIEKEDLEIFFS